MAGSKISNALRTNTSDADHPDTGRTAHRRLASELAYGNGRRTQHHAEPVR